MEGRSVGEGKRRILEWLKRSGPASSAELARAMELTVVAIRQHLQALEELGLVKPRKIPEERRGRPTLDWSLTPLGHRLFPDRHGELTVELIAALRRALGDEGLSKVVEARAQDQVREYRQELPSPASPLRKRVEALARRRSEEGYMAEVVTERPGCYLLIEHHCPICDAAQACSGLCTAELEVFRRTLGPDVTVERTAHILQGDARCIYRVAKK